VSFRQKRVATKSPVYRKESFPSKEYDTEILQSIYFVYKAGIISPYSNSITLYKTKFM